MCAKELTENGRHVSLMERTSTNGLREYVTKEKWKIQPWQVPGRYTTCRWLLLGDGGIYSRQASGQAVLSLKPHVTTDVCLRGRPRDTRARQPEEIGLCDHEMTLHPTSQVATTQAVRALRFVMIVVRCARPPGCITVRRGLSEADEAWTNVAKLDDRYTVVKAMGTQCSTTALPHRLQYAPQSSS